MVSSSEISEERTPAPVYAETATTHMNSFLNEAARLFEKSMKTEVKHHHPSNPTGNITHDLRDHLPCHQNFNTNVEVILYRYKQLRKDYEDATYQLGKAQRDLRREVEEKESWKSRSKELEALLTEEQQAHAETREELARVQAELFETQLRLDSAIKQLADAVQKLEAARKALREMTRERDLLKLQVLDLERDLEYYKSRVTELQKAVDVANEGENCANDRNARLTVMLFQIEAQKAEIEREKDRAQSMIRNLRDELKDVTSRNGLDRFKQQIKDLTEQVRATQEQLSRAREDLAGRDVKIGELSEQITELEGERDEIRAIKDRFVRCVAEYQVEVGRLQKMDEPRAKMHKNCKRHFMKILIPQDEVRIYGQKAAKDRANITTEDGAEAVVDHGATAAQIQADLESLLKSVGEFEIYLDNEKVKIDEALTQEINEVGQEPATTEHAAVVDGSKDQQPATTNGDVVEPVSTPEGEKPATTEEAKPAPEETVSKPAEVTKPTTEEQTPSDESADTNTDA